jgi:hypothetical protein
MHGTIFVLCKIACLEVFYKASVITMPVVKSVYMPDWFMILKRKNIFLKKHYTYVGQEVKQRQ